MSSEIFPRCKHDNRQLYVSAEGYVIPCCWIGNEPFLSNYKDLHQDYLEDLNVNRRSVQDILQDHRYRKIEDSWQTPHPYSACQVFCSKALAANAEEMVGMDGRCDIPLP